MGSNEHGVVIGILQIIDNYASPKKTMSRNFVKRPDKSITSYDARFW